MPGGSARLLMTDRLSQAAYDSLLPPRIAHRPGGRQPTLRLEAPEQGGPSRAAERLLSCVRGRRHASKQAE
eukprot:3249555-Alexandrium_andersonii.AAC.1